MRHKLLLAVDGTETTWKAAEYVGRSCSGGEGDEPCIVVFHVLPAMPPWLEAGEAADAGSLRQRFEDVTEEAAEKMFNTVEGKLKQAGMGMGCVVRELEENDGDIAGQIIAAAKRHECDTIVIGRGKRSMVGEFFRDSVAEHLLRKPVGMTLWVVE